MEANSQIKILVNTVNLVVFYSEDYYGDVDLKALKKLGF